MSDQNLRMQMPFFCSHENWVASVLSKLWWWRWYGPSSPEVAQRRPFQLARRPPRSVCMPAQGKRRVIERQRSRVPLRPAPSVLRDGRTALADKPWARPRVRGADHSRNTDA